MKASGFHQAGIQTFRMALLGSHSKTVRSIVNTKNILDCLSLRGSSLKNYGGQEMKRLVILL